MKICAMEADLLHVDVQMNRQTDMTKLTVVFCNFANVPKKKSFPAKLKTPQTGNCVRSRVQKFPA